jgi:hypothetical protein
MLVNGGSVEITSATFGKNSAMVSQLTMKRIVGGLSPALHCARFMSIHTDTMLFCLYLVRLHYFCSLVEPSSQAQDL